MGCRRPPPHPTVIACPNQIRVEMIYDTPMYQFNMNISLCGKFFNMVAMPLNGSLVQV